MHALPVIKDVCTRALKEDGPEARAAYAAVVDPASVLEMAALIESLLRYVEKREDAVAKEMAREARHKLEGRYSADGAV